MSDGDAHLELLERFIARPSGDGSELAQLLAWMKLILREGGAASTSEGERGAIDDLIRWFPRLLLPDIDYTTATAFARILGRLRKKVPPRPGGPRIAVVGSFTTHQLVELFDLYLHGAGTDAVLYEAAYGTLHQELLDPDSGLNEFRPDLAIILTTWRDLAHRPSLTDDRGAVGGESGTRPSEASAVKSFKTTSTLRLGAPWATSRPGTRPASAASFRS
jgi:hypothetical protein